MVIVKKEMNSEMREREEKKGQEIRDTICMRLSSSSCSQSLSTWTCLASNTTAVSGEAWLKRVRNAIVDPLHLS